MGKPILKLDWCGADAARYAVKLWHYSRSLPPPPLVIIGAWEDGEFVGVVIFGRGVSANLMKPYGILATQGAELVRVALRSHSAPVSRIVSVAVKMLKKKDPGLRLLVSFADPAHGHHGGIYQAMGWVYSGKSHVRFDYFKANGKRVHDRMVASSGTKKVFGKMRTVLRPEQCRKVAQPGKHRYLLPLDDDMRERVEPLALPYPKRAKDQAGDVQSPLGGGTPTRPLQS